MDKILISAKTIALFPLIFIVMLSVQIGLKYYDTKIKIYDFVQKQAQTLNSFMMVHRTYYQQLYLDKTIPLNEQTLLGLPAYAAFDISKRFSNQNSFQISVQTVSDRARNDKNQADSSELKAMAFFRADDEATEYFEAEVNYYQYATPLFIKKKCLACHGLKEKAPPFIADKYPNAYNYQVGDLRGIVSIKVPKSSVDQYFSHTFIMGVIFDSMTLLLILIISGYLIKYFKSLSQNLEQEVKDKTLELSKNVAFLESHKIAMDESSIISKGDLKGNITYVNDKFCAVSGYTKDELIGQPHSILRHHDNTDEVFKNMWQTIQAKQVWKRVLKNKGKHGAFWVDVTIIPILDENNDIVEYISVRHNITEMIEQKEQLNDIAHTDALTGLGNRHKLNKTIKTSRRPALAIMNIDNFSQINDLYGHDVGDQVIIQLSKTINELMSKETCELYHLQGDEFVAFNADIDPQTFVDNIRQLTQQVHDSNISINEENLTINFSTAISFEHKGRILTTADMALKVAKKEHKELVIYTEDISLDKDYENNLLWIQRIKKAIETDKIVPFFQPIINNQNGKREKYETLVRLIDEEEHIITPYFFINIAKQTKYYAQITKIMIEKAFVAFHDKPVEFSVNITSDDIFNPEVKTFLFEKLEQYPIGNRLVLEIVESESIENFSEVARFMDEVKSHGCKVAIDDFGTGYSNFEYLLKLKPDFIKIDGSMIREIHKNQDAAQLVSVIVAFAQKMGIQTVAEFVEDGEIEAMVKQLGIDYSQGYLYSEPTPKVEF